MASTLVVILGLTVASIPVDYNIIIMEVAYNSELFYSNIPSTSLILLQKDQWQKSKVAFNNNDINSYTLT